MRLLPPTVLLAPAPAGERPFRARESRPGTYRSTPSGAGLLVFVRRGAPGLLLRLLLVLLPLPPIPRSPGSSMRSKRLRLGLTAVSKGLRVAVPRPRVASMVEDDEASGRRVRRMGWPFALAPSNSRIAVRASLRAV